RQMPSLIETLRVERGGATPLLEGHLERLRRSCGALGHPWPGDRAIRELLMERLAGMDAGREWRFRLLLAPDGGLSLERAPLEALSGPLRVAVVGPRTAGAADWLRHKTTHRPWYEDAG